MRLLHKKIRHLFLRHYTRKQRTVIFYAFIICILFIISFFIRILEKKITKTAPSTPRFQRQLFGPYAYSGKIPGTNMTASLGVEKENAVINIGRGGGTIQFNLPLKNATLNSKDGVITYSIPEHTLDVRYQLTQKGVKEEIILNKTPNTSQLKSNLELRDLILKITPEGTPVFYNAKGEYQFHFERPFIKDAKGNISYGVKYKFAPTADNTNSPIEQPAPDSNYQNTLFKKAVEKVENGIRYSQRLLGSSKELVGSGSKQETYVLFVEIDPAWLYDKKRTFPIIIDPTVVYDTSSEFAAGTLNRLTDIGSGTAPMLQTYYQELPATLSVGGLWHMNEGVGATAVDSSGNGNAGALGVGSSAPAWQTSANSRLGASSLSFDGNDYVQVTHKDTLSPNTISVTAWIKTGSSTFQHIFGKYGGDWKEYFLRVQDNGTVTFLIGGGTDNNQASTSTITVNDNQWHYVVGTYDGKYIQVYVDGKQSGSPTAQSTFLHNSNSVIIGKASWYNDFFFNGLIDEVAIYNRALTPEEIKLQAQRRPYSVFTSDVVELINVKSGILSWNELGVQTGDGEILAGTANLVAQWNLNELTGGTANNNSGTCGATCNGNLTGFQNTTGQDIILAGSNPSGWTANNKRWGAGALIFDGVNDYVSTSLQISPAQYASLTIEAWVRPNGSTGYYQAIMAGDDGGYDRGFGIKASSTNFSVQVGNQEWNTGVTADIGQWQHVVVIYTASQITFYKNGVGYNYGSGGSFGTSTQALEIGKDTACGANCIFGGVIDTARIYSRALTASEILSNYQAGNIEFQTRTGTTTNPNDGTWEEWKPVTGETQLLSMDNDALNWPTIGTQTNPGISCSDILDKGGSIGDGLYWINPQGITPTQVYCDMTYGGWTRLNGNVSSSTVAYNGSDTIITNNIPGGCGTPGYAFTISNITVPYTHVKVLLTRTTSIAQCSSLVGGVTNGTYWNGSSWVSNNMCVWSDGIWANATSTDMTNLKLSWKMEGPKASNNQIKFSSQCSDGTDVGQIQATAWVKDTSRPRISKTNESSIKIEGAGSMKVQIGAPQVDGNTVGLWHLDETSVGTGSTAYDSSGNNNHGAATGTTLAEGISGKARSFNGTSEYININSVNPFRSYFTMEAWVNFTAVNKGSDNGIIGHGTAAVGNGLHIGERAGKAYFGFYGDDLSGITTLSPGQWYHLTYVFDGGKKIYVNGILDSLGTSGTYQSASTNAQIGQYPWGTTSKMSGKIDELRISNIARSADEIAEAYRAGRDHHFSKTISSTDLSTKTKVPFWVASDRQGTFLETTVGESLLANNEPDTNTVGLWHLDENNQNIALPITSGLSLWVKADAISGLSDGASVSTWTDLSIYGRNLTQATGSKQPIYKTNIINGLPVVRFTAASVQEIANANNFTTPTTVIYVGKQTGGANARVLTSVANNWLLGFWGGGKNQGFFNGWVTPAGTPATDTSWHVFSAVETGALSSVYADGGLVASNAGGVAGPNGISIGCWTALECSNADVAEVIIYNSALSASDRASVEAYLNAKYNINGGVGMPSYLKDSSGNGNNGAPAGTTFTQGKIGKARSFNGSSDYISTGSSINLANSSFTLEAWAKRGVIGAYHGIIGQGAYSTNNGLQFGFRSTNVFFCGFYANDLDTITTYTDTDWHYWVCSFDSNTKQRILYQDGVLIASNTATANYTGTGQLNIGGLYSTPASFFQGIIDEVRISNITRTAGDIRQAYEIGRRTHPITIDFKAKLDGGNLIADSSDLSFIVDGTGYGASIKGAGVYVGDKIIVKENYNGTEYIAQGTVSSVTASTGAVTVINWDAGSTFPTGGQTGFSANATVFKWQKEYFDLTGITTGVGGTDPINQKNAINRLTFRVTDGSEGANIWLDDMRYSDAYLTNFLGSTVPSSTNRYFQYRTILSSNDTQVSPSLSSVTLDYTQNKLILLTDGTVPAGWSCVSCDTTAPFYQKYIRGAAAYSTIGGGTETHTPSVATNTVNATTSQRGTATTNSRAATAHQHTSANPTMGSANNLPEYRTLKVISYDNGIPTGSTAIPAGAIAIFANTVPSNWIRYSAADGKYIRGDTTPSLIGGTNAHTHTLTWQSLAAAIGTTSRVGTTGTRATATDHTHNAPLAGVTNISNCNSNACEPPFITAILGQSSIATSIPVGMIGMFDGIPASGWLTVSGASGTNPFYNRFFKGDSGYGITGGSESHNHTSITSGTSPAAAATTGTTSGTGTASETHTHTITTTFNPGDTNFPRYVDVIMAKKQVSISGTVRQSDESTAIGNPPCDGVSNVIEARVNGGGAVSTTCAAADSTYSLTVDADAGNVVTLLLNSSSPSKANTVLIAGSSSDIASVDFFQNRVVARNDNGSSITNANLGQWDNDNDATNMLFTSNSNNFSSEANTELHIWTGTNYAPGGTVTTDATAGNFHLDTNSLATIPSGTSVIGQDITVGAGVTFSINSDLVVGGGDIATNATSTVRTTSGTPTVTMRGTGSIGTGGTISFYNLTIGDATVASTAFTANLTASGDISVGNGSSLELSGKNITVGGGDFTTTGTGAITCAGCVAGTVTISGSGNIGGGAGAITFYNLGINGTQTLQTDITISNDGNVATAGNLALNGKNMTVNGGDLTTAGTGIVSCVGCGAGTLTMNSTGNIGGGGTVTVYNLGINGTQTLQSNIVITNDGSIATAGVFALNSKSVTVNGGDLTTTGTGTITCAGCSAGTVTMTTTGNLGGGNGNLTFYNLSTSTSGATTFSGGGTNSALNSVSVGTGTTLNLNSTISITGSLTNTTTGVIDYTSGTPTVTVSGSTIGGGSGGITFYNLTKSATGNTTFSGSGANSINNALTISAGTFTQANNIIIGTSGVVNSGAISATGTLTYSGTPTMEIRSSSGGSATIGGAGSITFYNLLFTPAVASPPTLTLGSAGSQTVTVTNDFTVGNGTNGVIVNTESQDPTLNINGNFSTLASGTFQSSSTGTFTIAKNFTNNGTFTPNTGTVTFDTSNTAILTYTAATTFYGFSSSTASKVFYFDNVDQTNVTGSFSINGGACGTMIQLYSDSTGNQYDLNVTGSKSVQYADIKDSNAVAAITATTSRNSGNNSANWSIGLGACGSAISGNIYSNEGGSAIDCSGGNTKTVTVKVQGQAAYSGTCTTADGAYSVDATIANANDVITAYLDGATEKATTVTLAVNTGPLSGLDLYQNRNIFRHENAGPITNADLGQWDSDDDSDIQFTSNSNNLSVLNGTELHVFTGKTYSPGGTVSIATGSVGNFHVQAGALATIDTGSTNTIGRDIIVGSGGVLRINASTNISGGDITTAGTGSVTTTSGTPVVTISGSGNIGGGSGDITFYDLAINGTQTLSTAITANSDISVGNAASLELNGKNVNISGGAFTTTGTGTITCAGCAAGTVTITGTGNIGGGGTVTVYDLTKSTNGTSTVSSATTVLNDLDVGASTTLNGSGDLTVNGGDMTGTGTISMSGGTTLLAGTGTFGNTTDWSFNNLTFGDGSANATTAYETSTITVNGILTVASSHILNAGSKTWKLMGNGTPLVISGTFNPQTSTVSYENTTSANVTSTAYGNLQFSPASGTPTYTLLSGALSTVGNFTLAGAGNGTVNAESNDPSIDINGNFVVGTGDTFQASSTGSFTVSDNLTNNGTFTANTGTVMLDTTNTSIIGGTGNPTITFNNLTSIIGGKTIQFTQNLTFRVNGLLTLTGTHGNNLQINSTTSSQWFINHQGTENVQFVTVTNSGCNGSSADISVYYGSNGGNNGACWLFESVGFRIDGLRMEGLKIE